MSNVVVLRDGRRVFDWKRPESSPSGRPLAGIRMGGRVCAKCGEPCAGKSPWCAMHRDDRRRAINREHYARWIAKPGNAERREEQRRTSERNAAIRRLEARAAELGFRLVPA